LIRVSLSIFSIHTISYLCILSAKKFQGDWFVTEERRGLVRRIGSLRGLTSIKIGTPLTFPLLIRKGAFVQSVYTCRA
jgi:hypothetical protein